MSYQSNIRSTGFRVPSMMDPDPVRCRRTDGKKWRCRLTVLPNQKYCERHIHRGRFRSRKPVEVHKTFSTSNPSSISFLKSAPNLQPDSKNNAAAREHNKVNITNQSFKTKKPLEFGFSPINVLQNGNVRGCGTSNDHKSGILVAGSVRCRRTDGKKWRCRKDAVPEQMYCVQHMHRGVKRVKNGQNSNTSLSFAVGSSYQQTGDDGNRSNDPSSNSHNENGATNSSSSDATTVST